MQALWEKGTESMLQHVMGVCFELPGLVAWWSRSAPSVNMAAIWQLQPNLLALIFLPYLQEVHSTTSRRLEASWAPV